MPNFYIWLMCDLRYINFRSYNCFWPKRFWPKLRLDIAEVAGDKTFRRIFS